MGTVLVIEDDTDVRTLLRRRLERAGHEVVEAPDGRTGVRKYRESPTDVIITDIIMPEQEGLETIMALRKDFPNVKIVAISGGGVAMPGSTCLHLAAKLGAEATFTKPLDFDALLSTVARLASE
jgi:DNA-binding NtrC family response regulator